MAIVATHVAAVQELYVAYFGRPADTSGLDYWTNIVAANNGNTAAVSATFAASPEYTGLFTGLTNAQIVDKIYANMFGRGNTVADGRDYWVGKLNDKAVGVSTIVAEVAKGAQTTDKEAVENKVAGATAFTAALDTPAENAGYAGTAALNLAKAFITGITTDATLSTAIAPTALTATVAATVAAGTPFTVAGSLQTLAAAQKAEAAFLVTADGDNLATTKATEASLVAKVADAKTAVGATLETPALVTAYTDGSPAVKAALVADQQTKYAAAVTSAQNDVVAANAAINKVVGLQGAVTALTAATTAQTAATTMQKTATADLAAKLAFYNSTNGTALTAAGDGTVTGLIKLDGTKLVLETGVTEAKNPGVTALLNSSIALEAADVAVNNTTTVVNLAKTSVDFLDTNQAEVTSLNSLASKMTSFTFAAGVTPTEAQIAEQQAIFDAKTDKTEATAFKTAVATHYAMADDVNPLSATLKGATDLVKSTSATLKTMTDAVTALKAAEANVTQYDALHLAVTNATKVFSDNGYAMQQVDAATEIGTASSDIFMVGTVSSSISLFNLQGKDALYIGSDYTLNRGALTTGNNAALEAFVSQVGADTVIKVETSVFGSGTATPELVTITLVGVDAAGIQLNNGIITVA